MHEGSSKAADSLVPGDKVDANIEGQKFTAEVKVRENQHTPPGLRMHQN